MSDLHYMQMYWSEFYADTLHMTRNGAKAYLFMIGNAWLRGAKLPDDQGVLARCAGCTPREWASIKTEVMALWFKDENGDWSQKRLRKEFEKSLAHVDANRKNGALGGRPKSVKKAKENNETPNPTVPNGLHILESESEIESSSSKDARAGAKPPDGGDDDDGLILKVQEALGDKASSGVVRKGLPTVKAWLAAGLDLLDVLPELAEIGENLTAPLRTFNTPQWRAQIVARRDARLAASVRPPTSAGSVFVERDTPAWKAWLVHSGVKSLFAFDSKHNPGKIGRYFVSEWPPGFAVDDQSPTPPARRVPMPSLAGVLNHARAL